MSHGFVEAALYKLLQEGQSCPESLREVGTELSLGALDRDGIATPGVQFEQSGPKSEPRGRTGRMLVEEDKETLGFRRLC